MTTKFPVDAPKRKVLKTLKNLGFVNLHVFYLF